MTTVRSTSRDGKPKAAVDVQALLKATAKTGPAKAKADELTGHEELAQRVLDLTRQKAEAERELELAKFQLRERVDPWHQQKVRDSGVYESTVKVAATAGVVRVTYQHRYLKLPAERAEHIQAAVGESYGRLFATGTTLKVRKELTDDPEQLQTVVEKLAESLGVEQFQAWFECEQVINPTRAFTERRWIELPADVNAALELAGVKQVTVVTEGK